MERMYVTARGAETAGYRRQRRLRGVLLVVLSTLAVAGFWALLHRLGLWGWYAGAHNGGVWVGTSTNWWGVELYPNVGIFHNVD